MVRPFNLYAIKLWLLRERPGLQDANEKISRYLRDCEKNGEIGKWFVLSDTSSNNLMIHIEKKEKIDLEFRYSQEDGYCEI
jgi:hypothetical protein